VCRRALGQRGYAVDDDAKTPELEVKQIRTATQAGADAELVGEAEPRPGLGWKASAADPRLARIAAALTLCTLGLGCQPEPHPPLAAAAQGPADEPAFGATSTRTALAADSTPTVAPTPPPPPRTVFRKPPHPVLQVQVSETPADDPRKRTLVSYDRLGRSRNPDHLEVSTDHNSVEFPVSLTTAKVRGVAIPEHVAAGKGQAMALSLRMPEQKTPYVTCIGKDGCGCEGVIPYAYVSVAHDLPQDVHLDEYKALSFWSRSKEPFELHMVLRCYIEPRPQSNVPPFNGYLDEGLTQPDPCWQAPRVELTLSDPIEIRGDDVWHRYRVPITGLKVSDPVKLPGGGEAVCQLSQVTEVAYVLRKSIPVEPGEYPKSEGVVYFDDMEGLTGP
jgi:hypothetical protein